MCWMLPVRSRENGTIIAHYRYLVLVMLAKLYGIAELNNGQALNASYPYTISELAKKRLFNGLMP